MPAQPKILITGATSGIGQLAAQDLAQRGAHLILIARREDKACRTVAAIKAAAPDAAVDIFYADFTDLASVVAAGQSIAAHHSRIDVLVNNAGLHAFQQRITRDGYGEMIAVNYFAPWLLTNILRSTLTRSAPSRIVTVGSEASRRNEETITDDRLSDIAQFSPRGSSKIYGFTKMLDIMFSLELARQLEGTAVSSNCLCPGFNVTGLGRELSFSRPLLKILNLFGIGDPKRGAGIIVRLATDPAYDHRSGLYISVKGARAMTPIAPADSEKARRELWDWTAKELARFL